ncbi:MAG: hypothetical protein ACK41D_05100 [Rubricoccaceae bacterium]
MKPYPSGAPHRSHGLRGVLLALLLLAPTARAQDGGPRATFYGFVKAESIYDTRQVGQVREGQFLLFPLPDSPETRRDNFLLTTIQTRVGVRGTGTRALGADVTGVVEGDFFGGPLDANISLLILRLAYVRLDWPTHTALLGQDWSPLFAPVLPGTISFNTGAPFQPFARQPQAKLTLRPGANVQVEGVLAGQRDAFAEIGGPRLQQQSGRPMAHLHVRYADAGVTAGGGAYYKTIRPTLASETFTAGAVQAYLRLAAPGRYTVAAKATYGADLTDHLMSGGFVPDGADGFAPLDVLAGWVDLDVPAAPGVAVGLFGGYLRNEGAADAVALREGGPSGLRAANLVDQLRLAPRVSYTSGRVRLAAELEATSALYGTGGFDANYAPVRADGDERVTNVRALLAAFYTF